MQRITVREERTMSCMELGLGLRITGLMRERRTYDVMHGVTDVEQPNTRNYTAHISITDQLITTLTLTNIHHSLADVSLL